MNTESSKVYRYLGSHGICAVKPFYTKEQIDTWNERIDPIILEQDLPRSYVNAQKLHDLNLLNDIFNDPMRSLIAHLIPNPVLHHCHIYEIEGNQPQSHIRTEDGFLGWHRDDECLPDFKMGNPNCISIFVYMTDVEATNGPFELANIPPTKMHRLIAGKPCYQMTGSTGYSFIFDRTYIHRAHPNTSSEPRRLLKLSIQPPEIANPRITLPEFVNVLEDIGDDDIFMRHLFGGSCDPDKLSEYVNGLSPQLIPELLPLQENSKITISTHREIISRSKNRLLAARHNLSKKLRSSLSKN